MPVTTHCPDFEYDHVSNYSSILADRAKSALIRIVQLSPEERLSVAKDTRTVHKQYFDGLTPSPCDYYAGHYRGENYVCLKEYKVAIRNDPMVGHAPDRVPVDMKVFGGDLEISVNDLDITWGANNAVVGRVEKTYRAVQVGVALFVYFLQIHPYANGNGHIARFFLHVFLARYGIHLRRWPMHPRPQDPPYSELIKRYRRGDRTSLERFVVNCI